MVDFSRTKLEAGSSERWPAVLLAQSARMCSKINTISIRSIRKRRNISLLAHMVEAVIIAGARQRWVGYIRDMGEVRMGARNIRNIARTRRLGVREDRAVAVAARVIVTS